MDVLHCHGSVTAGRGGAALHLGADSLANYPEQFPKPP